MTTTFELLALVALIVGVFGTLLIAYLWIGAIAKWVWLLTIRGSLVVGVSLAVLLMLLIVLKLLTGLDMITPLGFLIGLVATPFAAIPLADCLAFQLTPVDRRTGASRRNFIFADKRRKQTGDYLAPSIDP